jgi:hypothetical protein
VSDPLFCQFDLSGTLRTQMEKIRQEINGLSDDYVLGASETDLAAALIAKYEVHAPELGEPVIVSSEETDVDVRGYHGYDVRDRSEPAYVRGNRVVIHIPFTGDGNLFRCQPSTFSYNPPRALIGNDYLGFVYQAPGVMNGQQVRANLDRTVGEIRGFLKTVASDCEQHNNQLRREIPQMVAGRRERVLKNREAVAGIGLPMKRREDAAQTYAAPAVRRKPQVQMPVVKDKAFVPEPEMLQKEYEHILSIVKSWAVSVERSPHAFRDMGEEDLRWQILVLLNGHYEGQASGEAFNYKGKTDILMREGDRNVFIAECKIWKGEAELLRAIDQILDYLHWRDTKAALIVFNRNKNFTEVLGQIESIVTKHSCCKKLLKKVGETEWRFLFGNKDDPNRELQLAVLLFDVPKPTA